MKLHRTGSHHSEDTIQKMKVAQLGDKNPAKRPDVREKISKSCKGRVTKGTTGMH